MILKEKYEKATLLLLDMIIMSDRFDNELTSEKGVGKVFDKVRLMCNLLLGSVVTIFCVAHTRLARPDLSAHAHVRAPLFYFVFYLMKFTSNM